MTGALNSENMRLQWTAQNRCYNKCTASVVSLGVGSMMEWTHHNSKCSFYNIRYKVRRPLNSRILSLEKTQALRYPSLLTTSKTTMQGA
jgi:hypothetical protein